tara:strand:+ start:357 stop:1115 length:759 start_codon:yes stop_codon:yes gene_type:complete
MKKYNFVFVVAHPDDESLWIGGILYFLNKIDFINVNVVCMTGAKDDGRSKSFFKALDICGIENRVLLSDDLPTSWGPRLKNTQDNIDIALHKLGLEKKDVELMITHSPYGDEHQHPQHCQLYQDTAKYAHDNKIKFGFFSFYPIPFLSIHPAMNAARRQHGTHIINCGYVGRPESNDHPKFWTQFKINSNVKKRMLECYNTIDREEHQRGYFAWDSDVESLYVYDKGSIEMLEKILVSMDVPADAPFCYIPE